MKLSKGSEVVPIDADPVVAQELARLNALKSERDENRDRIRALEQSLGRAQADRLGEAAERLIAGEGWAAIEAESARDEMRELDQKRLALNEAIRRQSLKVDALRQAAGNRVLMAQVERHRDLVRGIGKALLGAIEAAQAFVAWRDEIEAAGVSPNTRYQSPPAWILGLAETDFQTGGRTFAALAWLNESGWLDDRTFAALTGKATVAA